MPCTTGFAACGCRAPTVSARPRRPRRRAPPSITCAAPRASAASSTSCSSGSRPSPMNERRELPEKTLTTWTKLIVLEAEIVGALEELRSACWRRRSSAVSDPTLRRWVVAKTARQRPSIIAQAAPRRHQAVVSRREEERQVAMSRVAQKIFGSAPRCCTHRGQPPNCGNAAPKTVVSVAHNANAAASGRRPGRRRGQGGAAH